MSSSDTESSVTVGDRAPDFKLFSHEQEPWRLSDHLDQPVVLLFFPGAFTSVCTNEMNEVSNTLDSYGEAHVVGISTDSPFVLSEFHSVEQLVLPLLSDHDAEVASRYGAKYARNFTPMELDRIAKRAAFVVDTDRTVQYAEVLDNAGRQPDFDAIKQTLRSLDGS